MSTTINKLSLGLMLGSVGLLLACQQKPLNHQSSVSASTQQGMNAAERFLVAYNQHDIAGMLQWTHPDIRYMFVSGDQIHTETDGQQALSAFLEPYFKNTPAAQSKLMSSSQSGSFIQQVEQAIWTDAKGQLQNQCSLSVYQLQDDLILNVWYFDAYPCPTD